MRWLGAVAILLAACGHRGERDARHVADAGVAKPLPPPMALPEAVPAIAVLIAADGSLAIAPTGGSWTTVHAAGFGSGATPVASVDALPRAILDVLAGGEGDLAQHAREMRLELEEDTAAPEAGADEVAMTYFDVAGADLPPVTPLVIADPKGPGPRLAQVLDKVGGLVAMGDEVLRLAAPWDTAGYGGVDLEDDRPAYDVQLGAGMLVMNGDWAGATAEVRETAIRDLPAELSRLRATVPAGANPTADVLVSDRAHVQDVLDAVIQLDAAGATTIGVGVSPFPYPR